MLTITRQAEETLREALKELESPKGSVQAGVQKLHRAANMLSEEIHYPIEERKIKEDESGGGYKSIGTVEEIYENLVKTKRGNDGTFYQVPLREHINYVRRVAHEKAAKLFNRIAFSNSPQTSLDILRAEVNNSLLDLAPEAAEKLMIAFKSVASDNPEEWAHALTSCRRFIEDLADILYPAKDQSRSSFNNQGYWPKDNLSG